MSEDDRVLELHRRYNSEQTKYAYFLLAAAASGIALAVRTTTGASPTWTLLLVAGAVVAWSVSFYRGCRYP